jgi:hypothetical protein
VDERAGIRKLTALTPLDRTSVGQKAVVDVLPEEVGFAVARAVDGDHVGGGRLFELVPRRGPGRRRERVRLGRDAADDRYEEVVEHLGKRAAAKRHRPLTLPARG